MNKKEAKDIFEKIKQEYDKISFPKYHHASLIDLKEQYRQLREIGTFLKNDFVYARLINSISQIIKRLDRKGTRISTSERGINKAIHPLSKRGNKDTTVYEWESDKTRKKCMVTNGYWDVRNYIVMDVIGYFYLIKEGGGQLPKNVTPIFQNFESIKKREQELDVNNINKNNLPTVIMDNNLPDFKEDDYYVKFTDQKFREYTGLNLCSNDILDLLLRTSRTEFKITFPIRIIKNEGKEMKEKWYSMNVFSRPFEIGYINQDERSDGIVQRRVYYILFNTILGQMFIHNLLTKNYDFISNKFYHLPQSSQIFYRRFLLHHNYRKEQINLSTIKEGMKFQDKNITNLISNLEINTLNPLVKEGLIVSYKQVKGTNGIKYEIVLPKKGDHLQQTEATCIS